MTELLTETRGAFLLTQNSVNFNWCIKWNGPLWFGLTGIFETSFESGPLCLVGLSRSVGQKICPFPFDKLVVLSTALLSPAYKINNQTHGGLVGSVQPLHWARRISAWKAPKVLSTTKMSLPM